MLSANLRRVVAQYPDLSADGLNTPLADRFRGRQELYSEVEGFEAAARWLSQFSPVDSPTVGFYYLKHVAEPTIGYCTNGCMIAAALWLGYPVSRVPGSVNADVGISLRELRPVAKLHGFIV